MNIDAFINDTVTAHNRRHLDIIINKSRLAGWSWYFLYIRDFDIWGIEEWHLYKFIYDNLSHENIFPSVMMRDIDGKAKIGIAFEVRDSL